MLTVGILNSMPDAAVRSTERQFIQLLAEAGIGPRVRIRWYSLKPRHGYRPLDDLWATSHLDGLIATGTEPRAPQLTDEPYWPAFCRTVDWAAARTTSAIWSCLAAHAVVLRLDEVERRPRSVKANGVFQVTKCGVHPLLADTDPSWDVPHSRWNDLPLRSLVARGYQIHTDNGEVGADLFVKTCGRSLFLFVHGHPEYDGRALMREYRRDVLRFHIGERTDYPRLPVHYFDFLTELQLLELRERALSNRDPDTSMVEFQGVVGKASLEATWKPIAVQLFRNWLEFLATQRTKLVAQAVV